MFEELFKRPCIVEKYWAAALPAQRSYYLRHLADFGAKRSTLRYVAVDQLHLVQVLGLTQRTKVNVSHIETAVHDWPWPGKPGGAAPAQPATIERFVGNSAQWLRFLGWLDEPEDEPPQLHTAEVAAFATWAREVRGYSEQTIQSYCQMLDTFFCSLGSPDVPLTSLTISDVDRAIAAKAARGDLSRRTIETQARRLRTFFGFAEDRGWCMPGMSAAIGTPRLYRGETIPTGLARDDVLRLLATTEGDLPADKRDRAILMLLVGYGLRSGELRALQLDDIDWEQETLRVRRSKSGRTNLYPLSRGVGLTILHYLRDVRPMGPERTLFVTLLAPMRPLNRDTLWKICKRRLAQIGIAGKRLGPHALRHAAAQHLLDQGMSMKAIGDYLGHRNPRSTSAYAKVDLKSLRRVAEFNLGGLT